jgi:hypothetical protein
VGQCRAGHQKRQGNREILMDEPTSDELKKTLQELSTSSFPYKRRAAASLLGQISTSDEEIVRALAVAVSTDSDAGVRIAAMQSLQSPAHQAFLKDRPDFLQEAARSAAEDQAKEKENADSKVMNAFLRRRTRERIHLLGLIGSLFLSWILFMVGLSHEWLSKGLTRAWLIGYIAFVILITYLSWRNWRCPVCDTWLGGFTFTISAIWPNHIVHCPACKTRLL